MIPEPNRMRIFAAAGELPPGEMRYDLMEKARMALKESVERADEEHMSRQLGYGVATMRHVEKVREGSIRIFMPMTTNDDVYEGLQDWCRQKHITNVALSYNPTQYTTTLTIPASDYNRHVAPMGKNIRL
jgi:hypothetical protein